MTEDKRRYNSARREQSKLQTQLEIVEAALTMHARGITSLQEVAQEAGISVASIRKYFPTQEHLFKGCTAHFARKHSPPSPELWSRQAHVAERAAICVREIYSFLEIAMGVTWLAFRMQEESQVMKETLQQVGQYLDTSVNIVFGGERPEDFAWKTMRSILDPLFYRSLRMGGGFQPDECIRFSSDIITVHVK